MSAGPDRVLSLLGLAARAGSVLPGTERVREAVRGDRLQHVILAADASQNSRGKLLPLLMSRGIPYTIRYGRDELGAAIGRAPMSAIGVVDASLAHRIRALLEESAGESDHS